MSSDTHLSKFLSLVLRHNPAAAHITLDDSGWCSIDSLLAGAARANRPLTRDSLLRIVASSDKQRFTISDDGLRIRASQGHSIEVDLNLAPLAPPTLLYHGTFPAAIDPIRREGLRRMARHHVHLSADTETAARVGQRRGQPIILTIRAAALHAAGSPFYRSTNGVWLVDAVPPSFIDFP